MIIDTNSSIKNDVGAAAVSQFQYHFDIELPEQLVNVPVPDKALGFFNDSAHNKIRTAATVLFLYQHTERIRRYDNEKITGAGLDAPLSY